VHDPDHAAPLRDGPDLVVVEVAPRRVHAGDAGVGHDRGEGPVVGVEGVPEGALRGVGQVDQDASLVEGPDQGPPRRRQPATPPTNAGSVTGGVGSATVTGWIRTAGAAAAAARRRARLARSVAVRVPEGRTRLVAMERTTAAMPPTWSRGRSAWPR